MQDNLGLDKKELAEIKPMLDEIAGAWERVAEVVKNKNLDVNKESLKVLKEEESFYIKRNQENEKYAEILRDVELAQIRLNQKEWKEEGYGVAYQLQRSTDDAKKVLDEHAKNFGTFWERAKLALSEGYKKYKEKLTKEDQVFPFSKEAMKGMKESMGSNLGEALNDIVSRTKSAKDAFKDLGDSVISDIGRIVTRMMAVQAVQALFGGIGMLFAEGGVMPGEFMPVTPMAYGGVYNRPTLGLVAEAGTPEAVVPLKGGGVPVRFVGDQAKGQRQERPTYIVNAFSETFMQQQINKALSQNAEVIVNMVQSDIMSGGSTYQLIRGLR